MQNPFRSEASAYRFALISVGYFAAIVIAKVAGGTWPAVGVFVVLSAAIGWWIMTGGKRERPVPQAPPHTHPEDERRVLVVANETVGGTALCDVIRDKTEGYRSEVLVVAPVLNSPLRHWTSDEDPARREAAERLERSLERLRQLGIEARGELGDSEPLQAIEDWLRMFDADEVIISTHPEGRSHWLEKGVVREARQRFAVPITHVVVDLAIESEEVR